MGSLGDRDDEIRPTNMNSTLDGTEFETQPFDSQSSPPSLTGNKFEDEVFDELQFLQNTFPFADTVPFEDAFETQAVNLVGETQVLDDADDVANIDTQLLDDFDNELVDTDGGGTDTTELVDDTRELSDDDSAKRVSNCQVDLTNKLHNTNSRQDDRGSQAELDGLILEQRSSELDISTAKLPDEGTPESEPGSKRLNFTSVRAAALRASGLAARSMAFKVTNSQSSKQHTAEDNGITVIRDAVAFGTEVDQEDFSGECNEQVDGLKNENKCRVGSSTVRRLFMDDVLAETEGPNNDITDAAEGANLPQLPACGNEMVGLSYVDSQEPGELSQANALDFVDRFLTFNVMDCDQEFDIGRSNGGKSNPVSSAKGTQSLAKRTNLKNTAGERGIFDWDDSREDEGGGEFFTKKKEAFFDNGGRRKISFTEPQKRRHPGPKGSGTVDETGDKKERYVHRTVSGLVNSGSRLVLNKSKRNGETAKVRETKSKKHLTKQLDEQLKIGLSDGMEATGTDTDMLEMQNVGFDTQMASEAMELLCYGLDTTACANKNTNQGMTDAYEDSSSREKKNRTRSKEDFLQKRPNSSKSGVFKRNSNQTKSIRTQLSKESTISSGKRVRNVRKQCDTKLQKKVLKKAKLNAKGCFVTNGFENLNKISSEVTEQMEEESPRRKDANEVDRCPVIATSSGSLSVKKPHLQEQVVSFTPIARRTRQRRATNQSEAGIASNDFGEMHPTKAIVLNDRIQGAKIGGDASSVLSSKEKSSKLNSNQYVELENVKVIEQEQSHEKLSDAIGTVGIDILKYERERRTQRKLSGRLNGSCNLHGLVNQFVGQETNGQSLRKSNRLKHKALSPSMNLGLQRKTSESAYAESILASVDKGGSGLSDLKCNSVDDDVVPEDVVGDLPSELACRRIDADTISAGEGARGNTTFKASPGDRCKPSGSGSATPINCTMPINAASPICMGDEYLKQSCRKNLSRSFLMREINGLFSNGSELTSPTKDSRRRKDMANVRVLFSHHLDEDIIKHQKKILARLGASVAASISEATHFITDKFVRTRNMLEAIAFGKPVVTHLWLKSCGQASCFIDERNYILRDAKKEKEFGFSLPVSLARACQHPLLQGQKVFITPNTKPGKEVLASLVKAVHGMAVERFGRSAFKDDKILDDLLVLSCEEDYALCVPFLEKGAAVYSSELLLNGIVAQKLEYERHRLFVDQVKRTRSTIWVKQDSDQYRPVAKLK
ncbi:BRCT domain-containing DNA repair protein [Actinidia rufa]|uniref:BRCT domain-containing DNA repair protein n=1 Tax=Actinidia rufa TaxID=165716 RepID=A0A7J0GT95_9ERIC|nr:BRCT domain-containing DNA repair protein [Actinidia rufa]